MYFQTFNHIDNYEDNDKENDKENDEQMNICVVCLEKTHKKLSEISLVNAENKELEKNCSCECYIHDNCLTIWTIKCESCPICREKFILVEDEETFYIMHFYNLLLKIYCQHQPSAK
jgi:hypothetical protein